MNELDVAGMIPANDDPGDENPYPRYREGTSLRQAIETWQDKRREDTHRKVAAASAAVSREKYRRERQAEGKIVRPYTFHEHEPQQLGESRDDYERRIHRDRMRAARGVDALTVRPRVDLSEMSEQEKADHRRKLARLRKANERKRKTEEANAPAPLQGAVPAIGCNDDPNWGIF